MQVVDLVLVRLRAVEFAHLEHAVVVVLDRIDRVFGTGVVEAVALGKRHHRGEAPLYVGLGRAAGGQRDRSREGEQQTEAGNTHGRMQGKDKG
jgi:hypothetical protein